jgi:hypothetical protein
VHGQVRLCGHHLERGKAINHKKFRDREGKWKARLNTDNIEDFVKMANQKIFSITLSHEAFGSDIRPKFVPANTIAQKPFRDGY